ncbi:hypothetical protein DWW31_14140 [Clostridium sp. AF15-17LB]|nr:hypothetical protein DWW31_14140 [Clostridium sp. AF15-17LB]
MLKISGSKQEIEHIKSVLWCSSDCPLCAKPSEDCVKKLKGNCDDIDTFYECIEENILFELI